LRQIGEGEALARHREREPTDQMTLTDDLHRKLASLF
jgi:hypothetical protein